MRINLCMVILLLSCISPKGIEKDSDVVFLGTDDAGNRFLLDDKVLKKINTEDERLFTYPLKRFSKNVHLDWNNPFKLLLHYKDFNTIDFLDRELNLVNALDLNSINMGRVHSVAYAGQSGFWVYVDSQFKIFRFTENMELIREIDVQFFLENALDLISLYQKRDLLYVLTKNEVIVLTENGELKARCLFQTPSRDRKIFQDGEQLLVIDQNKVQNLDCIL